MRPFDEWATSFTQYSPIDQFNGTLVAIDAAHFLNHLLHAASFTRFKEPLLPALGGQPFVLKSHLQHGIDLLRDHAITPYFVFPGLDYGKKEKTTHGYEESMRLIAEAWNLYRSSQPNAAVETFGRSGAVKVETLFRFMQSTLQELEVEFIVAPYSSSAQIAYLSTLEDGTFQAVAGSSELLLFGVEKVITNFDIANRRVEWISLHHCMSNLGIASKNVFLDAYLLSGSTVLPLFPPLQLPPNRKGNAFLAAVKMVDSLGGSATSVCSHYQEDPHVRQMDYLDRYRRARMAIKHHIYLSQDGQVLPFDVASAPSDIHEFIGQRLPDELVFYMSRGVVGPQVLNWLTSGEVVENPSLDGGLSESYQELVLHGLNPLRSSALSLLAQSLHRAYQHKEITVRCWFDRSSLIRLKDVTPPGKPYEAWNVKEDAFKNQLYGSKNIRPSLGFALQMLKDSDFVSKSFVKKPVPSLNGTSIDTSALLSSQLEIHYNTIWRFLQLRDYVDAKHHLTAWGNVLHTMLTKADGSTALKESAILAVELLRLGILDATPTQGVIFPEIAVGGASDQRNCLLISRVACLARLRHNEIGFTGPLSQDLLAYGSCISKVRTSLRDLVEVILATLFLNGIADRDRDDYVLLGLGLPFLLDRDIALGIAVKSYLDDLSNLSINPDPTSAEAKASTRAKGPRNWFPQSVAFGEDLDMAFRLWDAVYAGVKQAGEKLVGGQRVWDEADKWLALRR